MSTLEGKVALISGAARGQGRSHALRLASEGAEIVALDICSDTDTIDYSNSSKEDLEETARLVEGLGRQCLARQVDVRDWAAVRSATQECVERFGRIDIVLPAAGIVRLANDQAAQNIQLWYDIVDTNLTGAMHVVRAAIPALIEGGRGGAFVLTGSTAGVRPIAPPAASADNIGWGGLAYTASKFGLNGICKQLAGALAAHSIRVNVVHPTGVLSGMTMNDAMMRIAEEAMADGDSDNAMAAMQNAMPVQILEAGDISDAISFLVSDRAKWITGVSLPVDAGFCIK